MKERITRPGFCCILSGSICLQIVYGGGNRRIIADQCKKSGSIAPSYARNGVIYQINKPLVRPDKTIMDIVDTDPRFTILSGLFRAMDSVWQEASYGIFERQLYYSLSTQPGNSIESTAFFAPTNEAFKKAGFNSVEDLMTLNARSMPYLDEEWWEMRNGLFVTDSLLAFSMWGRMYAPRSSIGGGTGVPAVFWSNDLNNTMLSTFALVTSGDNSVPVYFMPLDFDTNGAQITVKVKGSSHAAATIVEADIPTLQGPLHAVDNLILSDKVKF